MVNQLAPALSSLAVNLPSNSANAEAASSKSAVAFVGAQDEHGNTAFAAVGSNGQNEVAFFAWHQPGAAPAKNSTAPSPNPFEDLNQRLPNIHDLLQKMFQPKTKKNDTKNTPWRKLDKLLKGLPGGFGNLIKIMMLVGLMSKLLNGGQLSDLDNTLMEKVD